MMSIHVYLPTANKGKIINQKYVCESNISILYQALHFTLHGYAATQLLYSHPFLRMLSYLFLGMLSYFNFVCVLLLGFVKLLRNMLLFSQLFHPTTLHL